MFISLHGVSTIRAASRTPSVALAKHWGKNQRLSLETQDPVGRAVPSCPFPQGPKASQHKPPGVLGLLTGRRGAGQGETRLTLPAVVSPMPVTYPAICRKFQTALNLVSRLCRNPSAWPPHLGSGGSPSFPGLICCLLHPSWRQAALECTLGIPHSGTWKSHILPWGKCCFLLCAQCLHHP